MACQNMIGCRAYQNHLCGPVAIQLIHKNLLSGGHTRQYCHNPSHNKHNAHADLIAQNAGQETPGSPEMTRLLREMELAARSSSTDRRFVRSTPRAGG